MRPAITVKKALTRLDGVVARWLQARRSAALCRRYWALQGGVPSVPRGKLSSVPQYGVKCHVDSGGIRRYGEEELSRLSFIKSAQRLGFNLDEIADLLRLEDGSRCGQARQKAEAKLADVRAKL